MQLIINRISLFLIAIIMFVPAPGFAQAPESLSCAFLVAEGSELKGGPVVALLEVALSRDGSLEMVERSEIDRIIEEQALQISLAADGAETRRSLGRLLRARLLVMLKLEMREIDGAERPFIEVVVSETEYGLRMAHTWLEHKAGEPEGAVAEIEAAVERARRKLAEGIDALVAVSPLVSNDLGHRYDLYQHAYASLLEQTFAAARGVQVVELEEARALSAERELTNEGTAIVRPLQPWFVTGQYRNQGVGATRTLQLKLELRHGERGVDAFEEKELAAAEAATVLAEAARQFLDELEANGGAAASDPAVEVAELRRQARRFATLGEWRTALSLSEAALLLEPDNTDLMTNMLGLCARAIEEEAAVEGRGFRQNEVMLEALALDERACELFEACAREKYGSGAEAGSARSIALGQVASHFWQATRRIHWRTGGIVELWPDVTENQAVRRRTLIAVFEAASRAGVHLPLRPYSDMVESLLMPGEEDPRLVRESHEFQLRLLRSFVALPADRYNFGWMIRILEGPGVHKAGDAAWLERLNALEGPRLEWVARHYRIHVEAKDNQERLDRHSAWLVEMQQSEPETEFMASARDHLRRECEALDGDIKREALFAAADKERVPYVASSEPEPLRTPAPGDDVIYEKVMDLDFQPDGWVATGAGFDLIWDVRRLYLMREPGQLVALWRDEKNIVFSDSPMVQTLRDGKLRSLPNSELGLNQVAWDGERIWVRIANDFHVIDAETGEMTPIEWSDQYPEGQRRLAVLGPGRIGIIGWTDRTWCAVAEYLGKGRLDLRVTFEARKQVAGPLDAELAFEPRFISTVRKEGRPEEPLLLVGRDLPGRAGHYLLLLNPQSGEAQIIPERVSNQLAEQDVVEHGGTVYWQASNFEERAPVSNWGSLHMPQHQLYRFDVANGEIDIIHNDLSNDYAPSSGGSTPTYSKIGFQDGYIYLLNGSSYEGLRVIDPERSLIATLISTFPKRMGSRWLAQSDHYGLVLMQESEHPFSETFAYRLKLTAEPGEFLDTDAPNAAERDIKPPHPREGREVVLRIYPKSSIQEDSYTTISRKMKSGLAYLEKEKVSSDSLVLVLPEDQPVAGIREMFGRSFLICYPTAPFSLKGLAEDDPYHIELNRYNMTPAPPPAGFDFTLQDARGNPLENAKVRGVYIGYVPDNDDPLSGPAFRFELRAGTTDEKGKITMARAIGRAETRPAALNIEHPDYPPFRLEIESHMPSPPGEPIRLPILPRNDPQWVYGFQGTVRDGEGRAVKNARIKMHLTSLPNGIIIRRYNFNTDCNGAFSLLPMNASTGDVITSPVQVRLNVSFPLEPFSYEFETFPEEKLLWQGRLQPGRAIVLREQRTITAPTVKIVTEAGREFDPGSGEFWIYHKDLPNSVRRMIARWEDEQWNFTAPLEPGHIGVSGVGYRLGETIEIGEKLPEELVLRLPQPAAAISTPPPPPRASEKAIRRVEGRAMNGYTGEPLPNIFVIIDSDSYTDVWKVMRSVTDETWLTAIEAELAVDLEKPEYKFLGDFVWTKEALITRTDKQGRFTFEFKPWENPVHKNIRFFSPWYTGYRIRTHTYSQFARDGVLMLPEANLYPAGQLSFQLHPGEADGGENFVVEFDFTPHSDYPEWQLKAVQNQRFGAQEMPHLENTSTGIDFVRSVPAEFYYYLTFTRRGPNSESRAYPRLIRLRHGERRDLGTISWDELVLEDELRKGDSRGR